MCCVKQTGVCVSMNRVRDVARDDDGAASQPLPWEFMPVTRPRSSIIIFGCFKHRITTTTGSRPA